MAAGPVSRILSATGMLRDGHSSGPRITAGLKRPTRKLGAPSRHAQGVAPCSFPIWSCSVWGLPCPLHRCRGGALLPHLFTLTRVLPPGRYVFCGTFRRTPLKTPSRTLSGTLLCGVRTFLPLAAQPEETPALADKTATIRSSTNYPYYKIEFSPAMNRRSARAHLTRDG